jgi:hypothetical protein
MVPKPPICHDAGVHPDLHVNCQHPGSRAESCEKDEQDQTDHKTGTKVHEKYTHQRDESYGWPPSSEER